MTEIELKKDINEPLIDKNLGGRWKVKPESLATICHTDSTHKEANGNRTISTKILLEDFGGYDEMANLLQTNFETGIGADKKEVEERAKYFGRNKFPPPKIKSIWELFMENFDDPINCILLGAAVVSIIIGLFKNGFPKGLIDGTSIIIALGIICVVNSANNWVSERRLAALLDSSNVQEVAVHRGSAEETVTIDGRDLVVGDVIAFASGMRVPADCIMISGQDVLTDESELTGEPDQMPKFRVDSSNAQNGDACHMIGKSLVVGGSGKALILAVGDYSLSGVIEKASSSAEPVQTGL